MSSSPLLWLPSLLVGLLTCLLCYVVSFYYRVSRLPKGPIPLPFIGNILTFRSGKSVSDVFNDLSARFSPMYTIYLGPKPIVVIADSKLGVEAMRKVAFAGRPDYGITSAMFEENSVDVFFGDYSREWEVLKKVAHEAIKKYTASARHPFLVSRVVDRIFDRTDADGRRFDINAQEDLTLMLNAILASAAFGKEYEFDDAEFLSWKHSFEHHDHGHGSVVLILFMPILKHVFSHTWSHLKASKQFQHNFVRNRYNENEESFDDMNIRTFCQAVISAQREAQEEDKDISKYLTINNLINVVSDLFIAGSDTTKHTLTWIFLFICKYPHMQETIRKEIATVVGNMDNIPLHEHKDECHYTMAFIAEVMRFRTIMPNGVPHKTTGETELAGYKIPKGTIVLHPYFKALNDPEYWTDPETFNPDRFLVDGKFSKEAHPTFIPFGVGRRSCPGNQLALLTMFLVIARMMQRIGAVGASYGIRGGNESVGTDGHKVAVLWIANKYTMTVEE